MVEQTIELIQRVQAILGVHNDFLDAVCEWYSNVMLARKVVKLLAPRSRAGARVSLTVNGCLLAGDAIAVTPQARNVTWMLTPSLLTAGDNQLAVYAEKASGRPLLIQAVMACQEGVLPWQTVDLTSVNPPPTAYLSLAACSGERRRDDGWELPAGAYLTCRLRLPAALPVTFSLALPDSEESSWFDDFKDVLDDIEDRLKDRQKQLEDERRRAERIDPARASRLESQIADLTAYARLQQVQIAPALGGGGERTLEEVIRRTGDPDRLIAPYQAPRRAQPAFPPAPPPSPPQRLPVRQAPGPARSIPRPAPKSGCVSSCLTVLVVGALIVGGLAYYAWNYVLPKPAVRFDSLTEGQTVAAGAPLQVWVSGEDLFGVKSVSLTIESGADLVQGLPSPAQLTFPPETLDTGTKVFTLSLKPYAGEAKSITLVASMTSTRGTTTARRVVKVGGTQQSLVYEINPPQPKAGQSVEVIVHAVNAPPGARVSYALVGTDTYHLEGTLPVGPDGTIRYPVQGGANGVTDNLDARIDGTSVRQTGSYHFGD